MSLTARMKGLTERQVLYGHVFRNAMLIVIAGFPGAFIGAFFAGALLIETIFSLDGLGLLSFESHRQPRLSGGVRQSLYLLADRARGEPDLRSHLHLDRSAHRFRDAGDVRMNENVARRRLAAPPRPDRAAAAARGLPAPLAAQPAPAATISRRNRRGYWSFWIFLVLFVLSCSPSSSPTTGRSSPPTRARSSFRSSSTIRRRSSAASSPATDYRDPLIAKEIEENGWMIWPPIRFSYNTHNLDLPSPAPAPPTWMLTDDAMPRRSLERNGGTRLPRHRMELARHRRPGPRRGRAPDLRLPHLGAVRPDARRRSRR